MHGMVDMVATSSVINKPATFLRNRQFAQERQCLQKAALEARAGDHVHERLLLVSKLATLHYTRKDEAANESEAIK